MAVSGVTRARASRSPLLDARLARVRSFESIALTRSALDTAG